MKYIKATTEHPFHDPWMHKIRMRSRVGRGAEPGYFIYIWDRDGVGWVKAKDDAEAQALLNQEPQPSTR